MKLFQKLNIEERRLNIAKRISRYENSLNEKPLPGRDGSGHVMFRASDPCRIAMAGYLNDDHALCRRYAKETVKHIDEWFYGSWSYDPADETDPSGRAIKNWIDRYREGVFWAATLGDWAAVRRFSEFPGEDLSDESERKSEAPWYLLLASYLRQTNPRDSADITAELDHQANAALPDPEPPEPTGIWWAGIRLKPATFEELTEHGSRKRTKLLATALRAIYLRKPPQLQEALEEYLRYYRKNEFPRSEAIDEKQSLDGTILYQVAAHAGLDPVISGDLADYIVRLEPNR
jgi:hypothetical protein